MSVDNLQKYYSDKIKEGYSSKTVRSIETIINSALDMAIKMRMISENPNLYTTILKKIKYEAAVLCKEEVNRILTQARGEELYPIVITTVYSGMRKGEVMALKWGNVDLEERKIYIKNSLCRVVDEIPDDEGHRHARYVILEPKTKKSIRMIPMLDEVYDALMEQKRRQDAEKVKKQRNLSRPRISICGLHRELFSTETIYGQVPSFFEKVWYYKYSVS